MLRKKSDRRRHIAGNLRPYAVSAVRELAVLCYWQIKAFDIYSMERFEKEGGM